MMRDILVFVRGSWIVVALAATMLALAAATTVGVSLWAARTTDQLTAANEGALLAQAMRMRAARTGDELDGLAVSRRAALGLQSDQEQAGRRLIEHLVVRFGFEKVLVLEGTTVVQAFSINGFGVDDNARALAVRFQPVIHDVIGPVSKRVDPKPPWHVGGVSATIASHDEREAHYRRETHLALVENRPAVVSVARIVPSSAEAVSSWDDRRPFHVLAVKFLGQSMLDDMGHALGRTDVRIVNAPRGDGRPFVALVGDDSQPIAYLTWASEAHGARMFVTVLPAIVAAFALIAAMIVVGLWRLAQTQARLVENEAQFRDFAESSSDWFWQTDGEHRFREFTSGVESVAAYGGSEFIGRTRLDMPLVPEDRIVVRGLHARLDRREVFSDVTYRIVRPNGDIAAISVSGKPVFDRQGGFLGYRGTGRDVSDEVKAQRELDNRARLLSWALTSAKCGHFRADTRDAIEAWFSPELAELTGLSVPDKGMVAVADLNACYLQSPSEAAERKAAYLACWDEGRPYRINCQFQRPDGRIIHIDAHGHAERDDTGRVVAVFGIVRDVTEEERILALAEQSRKALAQTTQTLQRAERIARLGHWRLEVATGAIVWSPSLFDVTGFDPNGGVPSTRFLLERLAPHDTQRIGQFLNDALRQPRTVFETRAPHEPDGYRHFRFVLETEFDETGAPTVVFGTAQDITDSKDAQIRLAEQTTALTEAQRLGRIGNWSARIDSSRVEWAPSMFEVLRYDPATFDTTRSNVIAIHEDGDHRRLLAAQSDVVRTRQVKAVDVRVKRGDGTIGDFTIVSKPDFDDDGRMVGLVGTLQDISERKESERQLEQLAYYDPLTGLANRALFHRSLGRMLGDCRSSGRSAALLLLDLDRFKEVNDTLGHAAGDELLGEVTRILRREVPSDAFLARLGGDEFAAIIPFCDPVFAQYTAETIVDALAEPVSLSLGEVSIGTSIGVSMLPMDGHTAEEVLRHADLALYQAKNEGRGRLHFFRPALSEGIQEKTRLARDLRLALDSSEGLELRVQPQIHLGQRRVTGFEALIRWKHPERGYVPPSEFIPVAESSGLICDVGNWILRASCRQMKAWIDAGHPARDIAVNVSAAQIWQNDFETQVEEALKDTDLPPHLLTLELTESVFSSEGTGRIRQALGRLKEMGVTLALDDFGTGYSSLGYLNQLPFHKLKIDRVFVDGCDKDPTKHELLRGIVALGRGLGMQTVAEGAETWGEVEALAGMSCDLIQGYVFARPLTVDEALAKADAIEAGEELVRRAAA